MLRHFGNRKGVIFGKKLSDFKGVQLSDDDVVSQHERKELDELRNKVKELIEENNRLTGLVNFNTDSNNLNDIIL